MLNILCKVTRNGLYVIQDWWTMITDQPGPGWHCNRPVLKTTYSGHSCSRWTYWASPELVWYLKRCTVFIGPPCMCSCPFILSCPACTIIVVVINNSHIGILWPVSGYLCWWSMRGFQTLRDRWNGQVWCPSWCQTGMSLAICSSEADYRATWLGWQSLVLTGRVHRSGN